jgi:hypothetical protein
VIANNRQFTIHTMSGVGITFGNTSGAVGVAKVSLSLERNCSTPLLTGWTASYAACCTLHIPQYIPPFSPPRAPARGVTTHVTISSPRLLPTTPAAPHPVLSILALASVQGHSGEASIPSSFLHCLENMWWEKSMVWGGVVLVAHSLPASCACWIIR